MNFNTLAQGGDTNATDASDTSENQAQEARSYSQKEVDDMMARMKGSLEKKLLKPYADLGDPEELRVLRSEAEKRQTEQQIKRGEFEKVLQELAQKKDAEIQRRDAIIREYKVDTPLLNAAAKFRSVNPEQVKALLKSNVRLNNDGDVEVLGSDGQVKYNDAGQAYQVEDFVKEWLDQNPHFVQPTPSTTNTRTNISANNTTTLDVSKLDMRNPDHRKIYAEFRKTNGIA